MRNNAPITTDHINVSIDIALFMKNVPATFEKIKTSLIFELGTFHTKFLIL